MDAFRPPTDNKKPLALPPGREVCEMLWFFVLPATESAVSGFAGISFSILSGVQGLQRAASGRDPKPRAGRLAYYDEAAKKKDPAAHNADTNKPAAQHEKRICLLINKVKTQAQSP